MRNLYTKFIGNKIYLLLLLGWLGMGTTSCSTVYYSPGSGTFSGPTSFCMGAPATDSFTYVQCMAGSTGFFGTTYLGVTGTVQWYYNTTGSTVPATSTALGAAIPLSSDPMGANGVETFSPLTTATGTLYYFADFEWSGGGYCTSNFITPALMITVDPAISPIAGGASTICAGATTTFTDTDPGTWSTDNSTVATISSSGVVTGIGAGTVDILYSAGGCSISSSPLTVHFAPPTPVITPTVATICPGGSAMFTATVGPTFGNIIPPESWESGGPVVDGWTATGAGYTGGYLYQTNAASTLYPTIPAAEDGSYFLNWDCFNASSGTKANIFSPSFSLVGVTGVVVTAWVWRDNTAYTGGTYTTEGFYFELNTTAAFSGPSVLGFVPRDATSPDTGSYITGPSTVTTAGWYQYTITVPASYAGYGTGTNYLVIHCLSKYGDDCYLDNVAIQGYLPTAPPTWSPTTYLFTNAGLTTPYTGTPTDTVYSYPTGISTSTVETYTATETDPTCPSSATATLNIVVPVVTISPSTTICSGGNTNITFTGDPGAVVSYNINGGPTLTTTIGAFTTSVINTGVLYSNVTYNLLSVISGACSGTLTGSCVVTVSPPTHIIAGDSVVCVNATNVLSCTPTGGTWTSGAPTYATINAATGGLTGVLAGTAPISYAAPTTGCLSTTTATVNPLPTVYSLTGGGTTSICFGAGGIDLGLSNSSVGDSYQLWDSGIPTGPAWPGTGSAIDFGVQTFAGTYTVIATTTVTGCYDNMTGTSTIIINVLPTVYALTGGGNYCAGTTGEPIGLANSQLGMSYQLFNGATAMTGHVNGTGSPINFGTFYAAGSYSVIATDTTTLCQDYMSGPAVIVINPLPTVYAVDGGGDYCSGLGGVLVGMGNSQSGIAYHLYNGTTPVTTTSGTGAAFNFGFETVAGTYSVVAITTATGCTDTMSGNAIVVIDPLPTVYAVTGGGHYCAGLTGVDIGLFNSDAGINYQLYRGSTAVGLPMAGTGSGLDFGLYTVAGTYTIQATNANTGCVMGMSGSATVTIDPLPTVYNVTGGGQYCADGDGVLIGLSGSDALVNYQLFFGSSVYTATGGTGSPVSFGLITPAGTYTVFATNTSTGCINNMSGSATVIINTLIYDSVSVVPGPIDSVCAGTVVTYTATPVGGGTTPTYLWTVNSFPMGGTGNTFTYTPDSGDVVLCTMTSSFPCGRPIAPSYSTTMTVQSWEFPSVGIASIPVFTVCEGSPVTFTSSPGFGGYDPTYSWIVNGLVAATGGDTFTYDPGLHDTVSVILNSDYECRLADSANSIKKVMIVYPLSVPSVEIIAIPSMAVAFGQKDTLIALVTNGGTSPSFQWYINNVLQVGQTADTFISNTFTNNDSVSCTVINTGTCAGIKTFNWVIINEYPAGVKPVSISGSDIRLLPNPNKGAFTLKGNWAVSDNADVDVQVTDMLGQVVYRGTVGTQQGEMNEHITLGNTLASGVYLLNLHRGMENKVFHFVVEQ